MESIQNNAVPLKVGDKVCHIRHSFNRVSYSFATVERLTKTQAVLDNGVKLINTPIYCGFQKVFQYSEYGEQYTKWVLETPEIIEEYKKEKERIKVKNWFSDKKFSDEEKAIIYDMFKNLNKL